MDLKMDNESETRYKCVMKLILNLILIKNYM